MGRRGSMSLFRRRTARTLAVGTALLIATPLALTQPAAAVPAPAATAAPAAVTAAAPVNVLIFHGPAADQLDPVVRASDAISSLASANGITPTVSTDPAVFNAAELGKYRGIVFLSANGVTLTRDQETALQGYIEAGNGFLGLSDAARAQTDSTWFTGLIGTRPVGHREQRQPAERDQGEGGGQQPADQVAHVQPDRLVGLQDGRARRDLELQHGLGERLPRPRPAGLDPGGLQRRHQLDRPRHPDEPDLGRAVPVEEVRVHQPHDVRE